MNNNNSPKRRVYVFYIFGVLLSTTVLTVDIFSDKSLSTYLNGKLSVLSPTPLVSSNFRFPEIQVFKSKSNLINENIRLKNEVIELRKLKVENEKLKIENEANKFVVKEVNSSIFDIFESSIIFKTLNDQYIISGGENLNLNEKDLVIDHNSYVVGVISAVRENRSIVSTVLNSSFSIEGIDKYGNEYLITSDGKNLYVSSTNLKEENTDIKYIYTDITFGHPGQFPIIDLSSTSINIANNKITAEQEINLNINYFSNIYLVKTK
jgi:cell shape-determining protein MreC